MSNPTQSQLMLTRGLPCPKGKGSSTSCSSMCTKCSRLRLMIGKTQSKVEKTSGETPRSSGS